MNDHFLEVIQSLEPTFQTLLAMPAVTALALPKDMPQAGIYLFSENGVHLYVGRTRDIRGRIGRHTRQGATHRMAAFAFHLARKETGKLIATYKIEGSREDLMNGPEFRTAFEEAKKRIRVMELRFVKEEDPVRQAILEIYVAISLKTPYNDFDTH